MIVPSEKFLQEVKITPTPDSYQVNIAAVDLRVGQLAYWPDTKNEKTLIGGLPLCINPGDHFLIQTLESFEIPEDMMAVVYPRSGTNRKGITVDMTGVVDPGYKGKLMIPVSNLGQEPVEFYPGERIAQICFHRVEPHSTEIRESKYHANGIAALPDKAHEAEALANGSLFEVKIQLLNRHEAT